MPSSTEPRPSAQSPRADIANPLRRNVASIALHHQAGFRTVGVRERIGQLHGVWRDTVLLERRSQLVGC